jgi:hypothetical protein
MNLSAQEFTKIFFSLPEQEQEEVFNLISTQQKRLTRKKLKPISESVLLSKAALGTECDRPEGNEACADQKTKGEIILEAFENSGLIGCIESENGELSANYKDHLRGSDKPNKPLKLGLFKGKIKMSDDFNEPLPDSFWLEGKL